MAYDDNSFEDTLGDLSDELNTVNASSTTDTDLSESKNKYKNVLKKRLDAIEDNASFEGLITNTTVMQKNEFSFKPQIKTAVDQNVVMTGVSENRRFTSYFIKKETPLSLPSETKHSVCDVEKMVLKEQPLMALNSVKMQSDRVKLTTPHLELTLPHVKSMFGSYMWMHSEVLSQTQSKQGHEIKFASPHLTVMWPFQGKSNLGTNIGPGSGAQNREWVIATPSALKESLLQIFTGRFSCGDSNNLKGSPLTLFEAVSKNVHISSVNCCRRYLALQNFPVMSSHYPLSPAIFWQYPKVNSYRVLFAKKYYLFKFESNKVTSLLEGYYDRT
ncbi:hypothetical protein K8D10_22525 [Aeromonas veronii]|uniref:hypothetical protein n=1 Tax=Aeromonas veronii TaxID=654 RepID=UPI00207C7A43|nr:hypothetical protein [Aeromonas veronii]MCO4174525.1 hypothetical protein [Aeromonas veronii]